MIKIIYGYVIKIFIKIFIFTTAAFSVVVVMSQVFDKIKYYTDHRVTFENMLLHTLTNVPEGLVQMLPLATLLALLFCLGNLVKGNEITAMKAAGINMWHIISIFLIFGFIIGFGDLAFREFIVSKSTVYSKKIEVERIEKEKTSHQLDFYNQVISLKNNVRIQVGHLNTKENVMENVVFEKYGKNFDLKRLVLAEKADWEDGSWVFKNGVIRCFKNDFWDETYFKTYNPNIKITPEDITLEEFIPNSMSIERLNKYINQLEIFGQSVIEAKIALYTRFANAFSHIIVMMIGIPFAIGFRAKTNIIFSIFASLSAIFVYWATQAITTSFGNNLTISPIMASWLPNIIFSIIGVCLLANARK